VYILCLSRAFDLCLATFVIAFMSFLSEVVVYKTAPLSSPGVWPAMAISSFVCFYLGLFGLYMLLNRSSFLE
jgi:hypothetical protein